MDNLKYEQKPGASGQNQTTFLLKGGTKLKLGNEEIVLTEDATVIAVNPLSRDAVVGAIIAGGAGGANSGNFAYVDEREEEGTKNKYLVTYGGVGERIEKPFEKGDKLPASADVSAEKAAEQEVIENLDNSLKKPDVSGAVVEQAIENKKRK